MPPDNGTMLGFLKKQKQEQSTDCPGGLRAVAASDTGLVRSDNQDSFFSDSIRGVFCVSDGMGGGAEGAKASRIVCDTLAESVRGVIAGPGSMRRAIDGAISSANGIIYEYASKKGFRQMGATAAVLAFDGMSRGRVAVCHIGDSRIYRIRRGLPKCLTRDHTVGMELGGMIDRSRMAEFKKRSNPLSHILTRAVGTTGSVLADWQETDAEAGDRFLICSDGVHDVVSDARIAVIAGHGSIAKAMSNLTDEVVKCGAPDNYTAILIEVC